MISYKITIFIAIVVYTRGQDTKTVGDVVVHYKNHSFSLNGLALRLKKVIKYTDLNECTQDPYLSCERRCGVQERNLKNKCFCDNECEHYGDCCRDFYLRCKQNKDVKAKIPMSCVETKSPNLKNLGHTMVSKCSMKNINKELVSACEENKPSDPFWTLPVYSSSTNLTYRNVFCARCNNVINFVYWNFKGDCSHKNLSFFENKSVSQMVETIRRSCDWQYVPIQQQRESFCITKAGSCESVNVSEDTFWSEAKTLCSLYSYPTCRGRLQYSRNPHCRLCETSNAVTTHVKCYCINGVFSPDLSFLFDFSKSQYTRTDKRGRKFVSRMTQLTCKAKQVYDPLAQTCRNINLLTQKDQLQISNTTRCNTMVALNESDFHQLPNGSIYVTSHSKLYGSSDYYVFGNTAILCISITRSADSQDASILAVITFIGGSLSVLGLSILLALYSWFSELRNLPGKIVMSLSGALLIYQVCFFLTGQTERRGVCSAVAILLHYFLLASFTWMSVMAFDVARTFSSKGAGLLPSSSQDKLFYKYCICGWGAPLAVVGVCVALDRTISDSIGYGSGEYCWIARRQARIFAFIVPVGVILGFNVVALTMTVLGIRKTHKATQLVTNRGSQRQLVFLTLKLFVILGLTWSLGFGVAFKETAFLRYPFTILNSLQGLLICLAFTVNNRVKGLIKTLKQGATSFRNSASSGAIGMKRLDEIKNTSSTHF